MEQCCQTSGQTPAEPCVCLPRSTCLPSVAARGSLMTISGSSLGKGFLYTAQNRFAGGGRVTGAQGLSHHGPEPSTGRNPPRGTNQRGGAEGREEQTQIKPPVWVTLSHVILNLEVIIPNFQMRKTEAQRFPTGHIPWWGEATEQEWPPPRPPPSMPRGWGCWA